MRRRTIRKEKPTGCYNFLALIDGSEESKQATLQALKVMDKEKDNIECLIVDDGDLGLKLKEPYEAIMATAKVKNFKFTIIPALGTPIPQAIEKYLTKEDTPDYDFVILGSKGSGVYKKPGTHYLGTVAEKVIVVAKTNLIIVAK